MYKVRSRAPLRLGFGGGGTDISSYCDKFGGYVLNSTINHYAYTIIKPKKEYFLEIISSDLKTSFIYKENGPIKLEGDLKIFKAVYNHMIKFFNQNKLLNVEITSFCSMPPGSGLGSSSTIVVSLIKGFVEFFNLPMDNLEIAKLAFKIERIDCGLNGGKQDQYSASCGGFNFMEFYDKDRTIVNPLRIKNWIICELEASLVLYFTGKSRNSADIINDQVKNVDQGESNSIEAMHKMKEQSLVMKEALLCGNFQMFINSMKIAWESKKASSSSVTNYKINQIYDSAISDGALAGKLSGAGGGGFMMFFVPPEKRLKIIEGLKIFEGQYYEFHFSNYGCQSWRV